MTDTLNIEANVKSLILKAMNKTKSLHEAAKALGITTKCLKYKIEEYKITCQWIIQK